MMEYIFFDAMLRDKFVQRIQELNIAFEAWEDNMGIVVAVEDDLSESLADMLEEYYETLQDEQAQQLSLTEGGLSSMAGFSLVLPDGKFSTVPLQPEIANRLLANFTLDEIQALFSTVARSALDPKEVHLCQLLHAKANEVDK
jgi:hypothetical protein